MVAFVRARESERADAIFRDPFARRLGGDRGEQIARANPSGDKMAWTLVMRTYLYDQFITEQIEQGVDLVVNLAAGLDTRPYRMKLPPALRWVEVDLPGVIDYKENILREERPSCQLERVRVDLSNVSARRKLFARLTSQGKKALAVTEGLLIYFSPAEVGVFARDLADAPSFQRWIVDLVSPGLLRLGQKKMSEQLRESGAAFKFGPKEGPDFFLPYGWTPLDVRSLLRTAARFHRLTLVFRLMAALPSSNHAQGSRPWSGICLLGKI
jgi:methyltransferase (TIGR00027 family)